MKQKDLMTIVFIAVFSAVIAFIISNALFAAPKNRQQKVEIVDKISPDFSTPEKKYFTDKSINPTQTIQIGDSSNTRPFSNGN